MFALAQPREHYSRDIALRYETLVYVFKLRWGFPEVTCLSAHSPHPSRIFLPSYFTSSYPFGGGSGPEESVL